MSYLAPQFVTHRSYVGDADNSRYTDLYLFGGVLYATTGYGGQIEAWNVGGNGLYRMDEIAHLRSTALGVAPTLIGATFGGTNILLTGGGGNGPLTRVTLTGAGTLNATSNVGTFSSFSGDMQGMVSHVLSNGDVMLYGALANGNGIGRVRFNASGVLQGDWETADTVTSSAAGAVDLASAQIAGTSYVFSAGTQDPGLTSWMINSDGSLSHVETIDNDDQLWIAAPTDVETATVNGATYLVLAAAGSGSLTVIEVNLIGGMRVVDHVLDNTDTRFDNVQAIEVVQYGAFTYVVAGGVDGGLTVFMLLEDGSLVEQGTIADTDQMALRNISAIEAMPTANGLAIFVASSVEVGVTRLEYTVGPAGNLISENDASQVLNGSSNADLIGGGAGNDTIFAGAGNDVMTDGEGVDVLAGGAGSDTFVFVQDGDPDTITDFDPFNDRIDLSQWGGLRGTSQLTIATLSDGFQITYGGETLEIHSSNWGGMTLETLPRNALIGLDRVPLTPLSIPSNATPAGPHYQETGTSKDDRMIAPNRDSLMRGELGDDTIIGGDGADELYGGSGNDVLITGAGAGDFIDGGDGDDLIYVGSVWDVELG